MRHHGLFDGRIGVLLNVRHGVLRNGDLLSDGSQWNVSHGCIGTWPGDHRMLLGLGRLVDRRSGVVGIDREGFGVRVIGVEAVDSGWEHRIRTDASGSIGVFPQGVDIRIGLEAFPLFRWIVMVDFDNHIVKVIVFKVSHRGDECVLFGGFGCVSPTCKRIAWGVDYLFELIHGCNRAADKNRRAKRRFFGKQGGLLGSVPIGTKRTASK